MNLIVQNQRNNKFEGDIYKLSGHFQFLTRIISIILCLVFFIWKDFNWLCGSFIGSLLVEINLFLFRLTVLPVIKPVATPSAKPSLLPLLIKFYTAFFCTALICFLVIKFRLGHPFAFLSGLSVFFFSLMVFAPGFFILRSLKKTPITEESPGKSLEKDDGTK
jgi:CDP-diglyceride synthetase